MNSYTEGEVPTGTGFHILSRGKVPKGKRHTGNIEICETDRYFTVTGHSTFEKLTTLTNQDELNWFYETYIAAP